MRTDHVSVHALLQAGCNIDEIAAAAGLSLPAAALLMACTRIAMGMKPEPPTPTETPAP